MKTAIGIYQITVSAKADPIKFEEFFKKEIFPQVNVGKATRAWLINSQKLLKNRSASGDHQYAWLVQWETMGVSPFGANDAPPPDPAGALAEFEAKTSYASYSLQADQV